MDRIVENVKDIMFIGEVVEHNEIFLELKMKMFDNQVNLNRVKYTDAFLEDIVKNKEEYICLPLVCDTGALLWNEKMTHLFNPETNTFNTLQIGSFKNFEITESEFGVKSLIGYARVPKRNLEICNILVSLHDMGKLKFSYEISVKDSITEDGVTTVDVSDGNRLIGLCVVTDPACPDAVSLLVAEDQTKGGENMEQQNPAVLPEEEILEEQKDNEEVIEEPTIDEPVIEKVEKEAIDTSSEDNLTQIAELTQIVMDLKAELAQKEVLISELEQYKIQIETAEAEKEKQEKEVKIAALREKASMVLSETEMMEIAEAINELDELIVMAKIGNKFIAQAAEREKEIQTASVSTPDTGYRMLDGLSISTSDGKYFTR